MLLQVTIFGFVAGLANFAGAGLVLWREAWVRRWSLMAISLAAGAMATTAITHLFPEAVHVAPTSAPLWALGGFAAFYLLYNLVSFHACSGGPTHLHPIGTLALAGILVHSFFDGVAVGAGFTANDATGRVVTGAVFSHQLPEGAYTLAILLHTGMSRKRAVTWTLIDSLVTPIGAITAGFVSQELHASALPALLGISSGTFLYVAASNLVPETQRQSSRKTAVAFLLGIVLVLGLGALATWLGLEHDHGGHPADAPHQHPDPGLDPDHRHGVVAPAGPAARTRG